MKASFKDLHDGLIQTDSFFNHNTIDLAGLFMERTAQKVSLLILKKKLTKLFSHSHHRIDHKGFNQIIYIAPI